jgi:hypothetical protein
LVVGDSQVFGLGVDDDATFSARLAATAGRTVLNAGVPTYGPREYLATARELLAERKVASVVVVLNFVNDPFELERPNRERHAVWDGWAVRSETAPTSVTEFPGRRWLFSRSHAVYAARRWLHERGSAAAPEGAELDNPVDFGTPSEGGLQDLVLASQRAHADALAQATSARQALREAETRLTDLGSKLAHSDQVLVALAEDHVLSRGRPGDIVTEELSESGREVRLTAAMIRKIAGARGEFIQALVRDGSAVGSAQARMLFADQNLMVQERQELRARLAAGVPQVPRPPSIFHAYLAEFKALCDEHGAELVVVALPIDVQVDAGEWAKYGVADAPTCTSRCSCWRTSPPTRVPSACAPSTPPRRCAAPARRLPRSRHPHDREGPRGAGGGPRRDPGRAGACPSGPAAPGPPAGPQLRARDRRVGRARRGQGQRLDRGRLQHPDPARVAARAVRAQAEARPLRRGGRARGGGGDHHGPAHRRRPEPGHPADDRAADHGPLLSQERGAGPRDPLARRARRAAEVHRSLRRRARRAGARGRRRGRDRGAVRVPRVRPQRAVLRRAAGLRRIRERRLQAQLRPAVGRPAPARGLHGRPRRVQDPDRVHAARPDRGAGMSRRTGACIRQQRLLRRLRPAAPVRGGDLHAMERGRRVRCSPSMV